MQTSIISTPRQEARREIVRQIEEASISEARKGS